MTTTRQPTTEDKKEYRFGTHAKLFVVFADGQNNNLDLPTVIANFSKMDTVIKEIPAALKKQLPFESKVANMSDQIKRYQETSHLKTSFDIVQDHIVSIQNKKSMDPGILTALLTESNSLNEEIATHLKNLDNLMTAYLEACKKRNDYIQSKNEQERNNIENTIKTMLLDLKVELAKDNRLQERVDKLIVNSRYQAPTTPRIAPRLGGS